MSKCFGANCDELSYNVELLPNHQGHGSAKFKGGKNFNRQ